MTRQEFERLAQEGVVILDGATGSNYRLAGMPVGVCTEQWAAEHPEVVQKLQRDYIDAGSQIVYAPTFGANRIGLSMYGLEDRLEALNARLMEISLEAAAGRAYVAGDLTGPGAAGRQALPRAVRGLTRAGARARAGGRGFAGV